MAVIRLSIGVLEQEEISLPFFYWLDKECKAKLTEITTPFENMQKIKTYHLEGDGIPEGDVFCDCTCFEIVPNVFIFSINESTTAP